MMLPQRARGAESRVENKSSNGPRRAQSKELMLRVFCDGWQPSACRGYDGIPMRSTGFAVNQGGTASLTRP